MASPKPTATALPDLTKTIRFPRWKWCCEVIVSLSYSESDYILGATREIEPHEGGDNVKYRQHQ